jgi:hypothetical protein
MFCGTSRWLGAEEQQWWLGVASPRVQLLHAWWHAWWQHAISKHAMSMHGMPAPCRSSAASALTAIGVFSDLGLQEAILRQVAVAEVKIELQTRFRAAIGHGNRCNA